ncbi:MULTISPECIES: hypothetical protein [unclassified Modestobacter]
MTASPLAASFDMDFDLADTAQLFVNRLRTSAASFAAAAGAEEAIVREAVPPARHRRSRCRVVLRYRDGQESDVTFVGPVVSPDLGKYLSMSEFDASIEQWLGSGQQRSRRWLLPDDEAADGVAVDVTAWLDRAPGAFVPRPR